MDQVEEIINTFNKTHAIVILGDMNASLCQRNNNSQDSLLKCFVDSNNLHSKQTGLETFFHPNKADKAEIDYILLNSSSKQLVQTVTVDTGSALNTSDHAAVIGTFKIQLKEKADQKVTVVCKAKWNKCEKSIYRETIKEHLLPFDSFLPSLNAEIDILEPLGHLNAVLKKATQDSIPKFKQEMTIRKKKIRPWSERIQDAVRRNRLAWWEWRKSGSPTDRTAESWKNMRTTRKALRKEQRQEAANRRREKVEEIMDSKNDSKTFYRLISNQRKASNTQLQTLIVDGTEHETVDQIREGWADHFQKLATPLEMKSFDQQYKQLVDLDVESIKQLCRDESSPVDPVTEAEVKAALKRLNNNKAVDVMGLTSEHFKLAGHEVSEFLVPLLNYLIDSKTISVVLKEGILTPIFKKGDPSNPGNYRGITVTPVLLKILEHILNSRHNRILQDSQSRLQKGFTAGCSSLNAALILTECVLEASNMKQDLFLTTLDTQKAFDVVDQNSLLRKLYLDGIHGDDWLLLSDLYSDCSSRIKWAGELSHPINIKQGVRQGGVLSTGHYKRYNNPLLLQLEERYEGFKIGSIGIPHITVADDLALLARNKSEMQIMVWDVENNADRERYCIHPTKSHLLWYTRCKNKDTDFDIFLSGERVDKTDSAVHLGILRSTSGAVDVEGKIALGRKTAYSLMGAGFHGGNGLKAYQNGHIWSTFVVPRLLYGLEVQLLKKRDIENLEKFQRKCLKQFQGLPDNTSSSA
ncbi:MAG: reverse transcriptase family protein, partial [Candidatus Thiodiazotropha endolucinida]|nr:reverse transcriptase family protein [Candidatus Thiodiazotropha taylori]